MIFHKNEKTELKKIPNDSLEKEVDAFLNTLGGQIIIGAECSVTVAVHINRLREKLEDDQGYTKHILTARGAGYRCE